MIKKTFQHRHSSTWENLTAIFVHVFMDIFNVFPFDIDLKCIYLMFLYIAMCILHISFLEVGVIICFGPNYCELEGNISLLESFFVYFPVLPFTLLLLYIQICHRTGPSGSESIVKSKPAHFFSR